MLGQFWHPAECLFQQVPTRRNVRADRPPPGGDDRPDRWASRRWSATPSWYATASTSACSRPMRGDRDRVIGPPHHRCAGYAAIDIDKVFAERHHGRQIRRYDATRDTHWLRRQYARNEEFRARVSQPKVVDGGYRTTADACIMPCSCIRSR